MANKNNSQIDYLALRARLEMLRNIVMLVDIILILFLGFAGKIQAHSFIIKIVVIVAAVIAIFFFNGAIIRKTNFTVVMTALFVILKLNKLIVFGWGAIVLFIILDVLLSFFEMARYGAEDKQ